MSKRIEIPQMRRFHTESCQADAYLGFCDAGIAIGGVWLQCILGTLRAQDKFHR
jgi:hypothetical protein